MLHFRTLAVATQGDVATVELRPSDPHGSIDIAMLTDLESLIPWLEDECRCSLVVFRGSDGRFCRGLSAVEFGRGGRAGIHAHNRWEKMLIRLERLPKLTVAAIEGACVGAGVQLALACDHRLATTDAVMQLPEVHQGYLPGMALFRLTKYVGLGVAKRLVLTARPWSSSEALTWGLIDWLCAPDALATTIEELVEQLLPIDLDVLRLARRLLNESFSEAVEDALGNLLAAQHRCISLPNISQG